MTATTQLARFRSKQPFEPPVRVSPNTNFRELWSDGLATVGAVTLFSYFVLEALRLLIS
jgi:hypothetical protein